MQGNKDACFTSGSDEWRTPKDLFNKLNAVFHFTHDMAATPENTLCPKFLSDYRSQEVYAEHDLVFWCNPPYSKCKEFVQLLQKFPFPVVMLLPARVDTKWFQALRPGTVVCFIKGRLKFSESKMSAPFPSILVGLHCSDEEHFKIFNSLGLTVIV